MPFPWLRSARQAAQTSHSSRRRPVPLTVEPLDDRVLPSATMVAQINRATSDGLDPSLQAVRFHGALYFTADDGHGGGLYRSDGTAAGTTLVKAFTATDAYVPHALVVSGGALFFTADDGPVAGGLWKSDGTAAGTTLVKDVTFSTDPNDPLVRPELADVNGTLYFVAYQGDSSHAQLWKSDGTAASTTLVKDFAPAAGNAHIGDLTNVNGTLYFDEASGFGQPQLWKSDGTAAGTVSLVTVDDIANLTNVAGTLYFEAFNNFDDTTNLWSTDGTAAGTAPITVINASVEAYSFFSEFAVANGTLFYTGWDPTQGSQLWETNPAGGHVVRALNVANGGANPTDLTAVNGTLYFAAADGTHGTELWKTDGSPGGTVMVKDVNPGTAGSLPSSLFFGSSYNVTAVNGTIYFTADDGVHGVELWKSDGTAAGTVMVKDINPMPPAPAVVNPGNQVPRGSSAPTLLTAVGGQLFFMADDGSHGYELWTSNGTAPGTGMVKDLNAAGADSDPQDLTAVNGTVFFTAYDPVTGPGLWKSDGTAAGTTLVRAGVAEELTNVNGKLFFTTWDAANGKRLWKTDGATTTPVAVLGHPSEDTPLGSPTVANGLLFFAMDDGTHGSELWRSDGTAAGTLLVKDINPGADGSSPTSLTAAGNTLYFVADDGVHDEGIWKTDGTPGGTVMVTDLHAGGKGLPPLFVNDLAAANGTLFFTASDTTTFELGKTDGTAAGTVFIKAIDATPLATVGGTLYFAVTAAAGTDQLWKSDGTAKGTVMLAQTPGTIRGGSPASGAAVAINGTLFFAVVTAGGTELWKSDGTAKGTARVVGLAPGVDSVGFPFMANVGGTLYFAGQDAAHGGELWKSDATAASTTLVQDIKPGPTGSDPEDLVAVNGTLFFSADDGTHGRQLWQFSPPPVVTVGLTARGSAVKVQEGQEFSGVVATFTDLGSTAAAVAYSAVITWGDGHTSAGAVTATGKGTYAVTGANTYTHAGSYAVSVKISRGGATATARGTATVTDAPAWAGRVFQRVKKGQAVALVLGTLTDTNPFAAAGDFTVLIEWGDGQMSGGTLKANAQKTFDIGGTHKYTTAGSYTLRNWSKITWWS